MAKGFGMVEQATQAAAAAREAGQRNSKPQIYPSTVQAAKNGGPIAVRFLEQGNDVNVFNQHEYLVPNSNPGQRPYSRRFTCLREVGQECPGCNAGLKMKVRAVFNVIHRNRPQLRRDKDNRAVKDANQNYIVDGYADEVVVIDVPSTTAEDLRKTDADYRGLSSRDFVISESGSQFNPFSFRPADVDGGPQPMSEQDQILAQQKHSIDEFMKPPTGAEAQGIVNQYGANSRQGGGAPAPGGFGNGAQGNANAAVNANGFFAGADPSAVAAATQGGAFGAAQAAPVPSAAPVAPPVPAVATQHVPAPVDPGYPPAQAAAQHPVAPAPPEAPAVPPAQASPVPPAG